MSHVLSSSIHTASLMVNILQQSGSSVIMNETTGLHQCPPKCIVYIGVHSWCYKLCGFGQCLVTCNHHPNIIQNNVTALNILCAPPVHPSLLSNSWQPLIFFFFLFFFFTITRHFPECHIVGVIQSVPISGCLLFHLVKCI